jgi:hypothetical protein
MTGHTGESMEERLARNLGELLQELRVALAGVQILFGFLLAVVFTDRFRDASGFEKAWHLCAVASAAAATALLTAPAAWHRHLFRTGSRERIVTVGNRVALTGLVCLALAVTLTVGLIAEVGYGVVAMVVVTTVSGVTFGVLWFVAPPLLSPGRARRDRSAGRGNGEAAGRRPRPGRRRGCGDRRRGRTGAR